MFYRESDSDESDASDDDSDNEEMQPKGAHIFNVDNFDKKKLSVQKCDSGYTVAYDGDTRIYIKSGVYMGDIVTYESKYSHSILVKKGEVLELVRSSVEKLLGKNRSLKFYGKNEASCASFFPETVLNMERKKCISILENETPVLMPITQLSEKNGCFTVVLRPGKISKTKGKEYTWKMSIVEAELKPIPKDYDGYFRKLNEAKLRFFS